MHEFVKCNQVNGVYWLKYPLVNITIKIKTRPQTGIFQLPRFEQYNSPNTTLEKPATEEHIYIWQEKVFSRYEIEKYGNVHNCNTDTELKYFEKLENTQCKGSKIFTAIHEDYYLPLPGQNGKEKHFKMAGLISCFEKLNLEAANKFGPMFNDGSSSRTHLFKSDEDMLVTEHWKAMHIVYDNSEYSEDSQLLLKHEHVLLSLYHNTEKNYLLLSPDTNDIDLNPYSIDGIGLQYAVEVDYGGENDGEELGKLLHKLHKKWEAKQKQLVNFTMPSLGKKKVHISLEIVSAEGFDMDNIYIKYHIKIPDDIQCSNKGLEGKTHTSSALRTENCEGWNFGHILELDLEVSTGLELSPIKIYLEVISTDWWGRHRTEGYTYLPVTFEPGSHCRTLSCTRPEELDTVEAESRRFFVGGCHLIKDLEVLDTQMQNASYRFTSTGSVSVRWSTLVQSAVPGATNQDPGAALQGADAALRRYRRARAKLAAVTMQ